MTVPEIVKLLLAQYDESEIRERADDQMHEYIDDDWDASGDYDSEYEWYIDHNNGEAEDDVLNEVVRGYEKDHGELSIDNFADVFDTLKMEWNL